MKNIDVTIVSKEEDYWQKMTDNFRAEVKTLEERIIFTKKVLKMCEDELSSIQMKGGQK